MEERRKFKRVPARSIVWYEIEDFVKMQAGLDQSDVKLGMPLESLDISLGGVQIVTNRHSEPDKKLKIILSIDSSSPPISILSRVAWIRPAEDRKKYYMGLEFLEFLNDRKKLLEKYINSFDKT